MTKRMFQSLTRMNDLEKRNSSRRVVGYRTAPGNDGPKSPAVAAPGGMRGPLHVYGRFGFISERRRRGRALLWLIRDLPTPAAERSPLISFPIRLSVGVNARRDDRPSRMIGDTCCIPGEPLAKCVTASAY